MKTHNTKAVEKTVAHNPPHRPPIQALKNTAGKNRNHTSGWISDQNNICRNFNRDKCKDPNCQRKHICLKCNKPGHSATVCWSDKGKPNVTLVE